MSTTMKRVRYTGALVWKLAAAMAMLAISALTSRAEVSVMETPSRVVVENESVRLVFDGTVNYVPAELAYRRGSGQNLIVDNFCLYYQYIENGAIRSVNEGYPGGQISNGRWTVEKKDGAATVEFHGDTPHFHLMRRVTVPATGPVVKFVYELECKKGDSFGFSLPYAPLSLSLNKSATHLDFIGKNGEKAGRIMVEDAKSPSATSITRPARGLSSLTSRRSAPAASANATHRGSMSV
jgi:hypothetical protein